VILAIDSGTTRTRVWMLPGSGDPVAAASDVAGARDLAQARDRAWLRATVRKVTDEAIVAVGADWADVEAAVGFGMITSELGLVEVPHLVAPVGRPELAAAMAERSAGVLPVPLFLVPGVRTDANRLSRTDVMRGEETEIAGLLTLDRLASPLLYVSPGSHSKFAWVDDQGRIAWSVTTLSGELLWALRRETILAELVDPDSADLDPARVDEGARIAESAGLTRALFLTRIANLLVGLSPVECSSLLHGAVARTDLTALEGALPAGTSPVSVALSGAGPLRECYQRLLEQRTWVRNVELVDEPLGAIGARFLYERRVHLGEEGRTLHA